MARSAPARPRPALASANDPRPLHVLAPALPALGDALRLAGRDVHAHGEAAALLAALDDSPGGAVLLHVPAGRGREALAVAGAVRRLHPALLLLLVLEEPPPSEAWRRASELTPACFPAALEATVLARLASGAQSDSARRESAAQPPPRRVVITLWESVALDDRRVYLGVAERNFLFLLARRSGVRLAKSSLVEAGPGRHLLASACRRRLGQRLGPELAELLVPQERFEPYRLREPSEVEAFSARHGHGAVSLKIVGRGEVRLVPAAAGFG